MKHQNGKIKEANRYYDVLDCKVRRQSFFHIYAHTLFGSNDIRKKMAYET